MLFPKGYCKISVIRRLDRLDKNQHSTDPPSQFLLARYTAHLPPVGMRAPCHIQENPEEILSSGCAGCKGTWSCLQVNSQTLKFFLTFSFCCISKCPQSWWDLGEPAGPRLPPLRPCSGCRWCTGGWRWPGRRVCPSAASRTPGRQSASCARPALPPAGSPPRR